MLRRAPLTFDQSLPLQSPESREERPGTYLKHPSADLLDAQPDSVSVHRLQRQRFQDQHVPRALHHPAQFAPTRYLL
jgi:hypothetical protein